MMRTRRAVLAALPVLALATRTGAQPKPPQSGRMKAGFIYSGPIGDQGWSYQHDVARRELEAAFPGRIETVIMENVAEGHDAERAIAQMARSGVRMIFATSFSFGGAIEATAPRYSNVAFEHATGAKQGPNVTTYNARFYEGRYIAGRIAGRMSTKGRIGYIASFPIPEVMQGINAFMLGAQSVNPRIRLGIVWVGAWYAPLREAEAAKSLLDGGADILTQHTDSPAALQVAEQRGFKGFGQASDMIEFAPNAQLTAIVNNWTPYYIERARAFLENRWKPGASWTGIAAGTVKMAPYANMPEDVRALAVRTEDAIREGRLYPFQGPVLDQSGTERVKKGEIASDELLLGMDWFVRGIEDKPPKP